MKPATKPETLLTLTDAARLLKTGPDNVRRMADAGQIPVAVRTAGRGMRLFRLDDVQRFAAERDSERSAREYRRRTRRTARRKR